MANNEDISRTEKMPQPTRLKRGNPMAMENGMTCAGNEFALPISLDLIAISNLTSRVLLGCCSLGDFPREVYESFNGHQSDIIAS